MAYTVPFEYDLLTYEQALEHLERCKQKGIVPLLETVTELLDLCGRPDACYGCIQIAGTNGKTSTSRYTAAILKGEGHRPGLYTSPELVEYPERMEINGKVVTREQFALGISIAKRAGELLNYNHRQRGEKPAAITEFDTLTIAALALFALERVDVAVLEVGMGGRWDATTATHPKATCITGIALDHTRILGRSCMAIAREKQAIIKTGQVCTLGPGTTTMIPVCRQMLEYCTAQQVVPRIVTAVGQLDAKQERLLDAFAHERVMYAVTHQPRTLVVPIELTVETPRAIYPAIKVLKPQYQAANIATAISLTEQYLDKELNIEALLESVALCPTPGRFDIISREPLRIIDAAHNPDSIEHTLHSLAEIMPSCAYRPTLLCAIFTDKDMVRMVDLLTPAFPRIVVAATKSDRAQDPEVLAQCFRERGKEPIGVYATIAEAVASLEGRDFFATGSITTAGEVLALCGRK
jgi:dihydrofolate synthase/folylpolyglutamate synthase